MWSNFNGIRIVNVLPTPSSLFSDIEPFIKLANCEHILNPNPVPPYFLLRPRSPWTKGSKTFRCCETGMPGPVSSTSNSNKSILAFRGGGDEERSRPAICGIALGSRPLISSAVFIFFRLSPSPNVGGFTEASEPDATRPLVLESLGECCLDCLDCLDWVEPLRLLAAFSSSASPIHLIRTSTDPPSGVNFLQ